MEVRSTEIVGTTEHENTPGSWPPRLGDEVLKDRFISDLWKIYFGDCPLLLQYIFGLEGVINKTQ